MTAHEMSNGEQILDTTERYIAERRDWLKEAADLLGGSEGANVEVVLAQPMQHDQEARRDSPAINLDVGVETKLREIAGRFGVGGEGDVTLEDAGLLAGHVRINEGGLVWKMLAEHNVESDAGTYIYAGSPHQGLRDDEREFETRLLSRTPDTVSQTQYEAAEWIARSHADFEPLEEPFVMPFGYAVAQDNETLSRETGQLVQIGTRAGKPVMILRVDRENYVNEQGEKKYRYQPDTAKLIGFVADVLAGCGDETTSVGIVTSNTYASRAIDVVRAGLTRGRQFGVAMYGRQTLADAKDEKAAAPTDFHQIPTELRVMHDKLESLEEEWLTANQHRM